jgi:hypothetical protein
MNVKNVLKDSIGRFEVLRMIILWFAKKYFHYKDEVFKMFCKL